MASYTNLASLAGLQVGDVITYNTDSEIDFKKYKVRIKLYGIGYDSNHGGGLTQFDFDTININSTFFFTKYFGTSLCYGTAKNSYKRIAVAGNAGFGETSGASAICGKGGGTTGGNGSSETTSLGYYTAGGGGGGTQTSGGSGGSVPSSSSVTKRAGTAGSFGRNSKTIIISGIDYMHYEAAGWYSGGTGGYCSYNSRLAYGGNGGGSGFVIGNSTTTYPSGYMDNDNTLISNLVSAISNVSLTQGGSDVYLGSSYNGTTLQSGYMTIEILSLPPSTFPQYYSNGWHDTEWKVYDNGSWHDVEVKRYNGSSWE